MITIWLFIISLIVLGIITWFVIQKHSASSTPQPPIPPGPPSPQPPSPEPEPEPPSPEPQPPSPEPQPPTPEPQPPSPEPPSPEPAPPSPEPAPVYTFKAMLYTRESNKYLSYSEGFKFAPNVIDNIEHAIWDVHFLGDIHNPTTSMMLQVPRLSDSFPNTFMSVEPYQNHRPSLQSKPSVWIPVDATDWVSDGTSISRDFLMKSSESDEYLGSVGWNPSTQTSKNGATLWTMTLFNLDPQYSSENAVALYGYLQIPSDEEYNYIIYDNAQNDKYVPRLGHYDLQNLWLFHLSPATNGWVMEIQVPENVRPDNFPKWFLSSTGKGRGNDARASKNRHAPSMDPQSNPNTKWTLHIIDTKSSTETATTYLVHIESNNHYFLTPSINVSSWRPSLTSEHDPPEKILLELVLLNGVSLLSK